jgi:hypothetical protein
MKRAEGIAGSKLFDDSKAGWRNSGVLFAFTIASWVRVPGGSGFEKKVLRIQYPEFRRRNIPPTGKFLLPPSRELVGPALS